MNFNVGFSVGGSGMGGGMGGGFSGGQGVGTTVTSTNMVFCKNGHSLGGASRPNSRCDSCGRVGLFQAFTCFPCDFDLCDTCYNTQAMRGSGQSMNAFCRFNHPLKFTQRTSARCDSCGRTGLLMSYCCTLCDYDNCDQCYLKNTGSSSIVGGVNNNFMGGGQIGGGYPGGMGVGMGGGMSFAPNTGGYSGSTGYSGNTGFSGNTGYSGGVNTGFGSTVTVPTGVSVKFYDRNHYTHVFVGNQTQDNDHTVYACKQSGFQVQNFDIRTGFVIQKTNDGYYQIYDNDHQAYLFVGNNVDFGGDHTVYASPQRFWRDYNDFIYRTSFSIVPAENGGVRFLDKKHNSYIFVGNNNQGGDHTLFSVPMNKYNSNPGEWARRTVFDIQSSYWK